MVSRIPERSCSETYRPDVQFSLRSFISTFQPLVLLPVSCLGCCYKKQLSKRQTEACRIKIYWWWAWIRCIKIKLKCFWKVDAQHVGCGLLPMKCVFFSTTCAEFQQHSSDCFTTVTSAAVNGRHPATTSLICTLCLQRKQGRTS